MVGQTNIAEQGFIAHKRMTDGVDQYLEQHLAETGQLASEFASKIGLSDVGSVLGLLHDFGKYSHSFQSYIKSAVGDLDKDDADFIDAKAMKGKIDHSTAGAQFVWQSLKKYGSNGAGELAGQILALCIASHHSGLIDCLDKEGETPFFKRMDKEEEFAHLHECKEKANKDLLIQVEALLTSELVKQIFGLLKKITQNQISKTIECFNLGFFTRFLFACLIDADRLNSAEFEDPSRHRQRLAKPVNVPWKIALDHLEDYICELETRNYVDEIRSEISNNCKKMSLGPQGIYSLTVPTGGGKTYSSLRFSLHHANKHKLDRIIYIIPYTSIIEQNAEVVRDVLERGDEGFSWVLEHHSNLEPEQQNWETKLVSENWDSPIIFTTMVQFLETLFSGGTKSVRRMHQLANSVLIFDEIQTLPINCTHLFCNAINFLSEFCNTTTVLCTATQPLLNELKEPKKGCLNISRHNELSGNTEQHFNLLSRVDINNLCKSPGWGRTEIVSLIQKQFKLTGSCLVIVNTKQWAQELYMACVELIPTKIIFHLSTNQCPAHRKILLQDIRQRLDEELPVLCISTQLIEAGVDIDFAVVIRFLAGLDSVAQAAGRCNRNGRLKNHKGELVKGQVFVLNPENENIDILKDIKVGKEAAHRVFAEAHKDFLAPSAIRRYFTYYFFNRADDMAYPLKANQTGRSDTLLSLLTENEYNIGDYIRDSKKVVPLLKQSFKEAGKQFKAIDAPTQAVIVPFLEGEEIISELCGLDKRFNAHRYYELLKKAQKYSVNVFPNVWRKLVENSAIHEIQVDHGIYYLDKDYYSEQFGLGHKPCAKLSGLVI